MLKRPFHLIALCCLIISLCILFLMPAQAQTDSTIRVYLRRLQIEDTVRLQTTGPYMLEDGSMLFADGTELSISLRNGQLVLHTGTMAMKLGESVKLVRCESEQRGSLTINGNGAYEGDLLLKVVSDAIMPILHIHVEDYLLGVVPFEMGDSFPLEALKAQAIAARTYALRQIGSGDLYDVEDTTNDQAYRGRTTYSPLSEQAVKETEGLCGTYQGLLAQCNYSASNGGQTELGEHVWPSYEPETFGHMDMRDDPYDYENEASTVKRFTLSKKPQRNDMGEALHQALVFALSDALMKLGKDTEADCVRIDEILNLELMTPKYEGESRLMTEMQFTLKISVRECLFRDSAEMHTASNSDVSSADATPSPSTTPRPTATPAYTDYTQLEQVFTVTLPVFPVVEQAMGLSINANYQNELMTITDIGSAYMIESRRYGHGVGMSQRGAEQMAQAYGMSYLDILSFYYPGMAIEYYELPYHPLPTADIQLLATPEPTPSPTPRPTLMPVTMDHMPKGGYLAIVSNINEDSSLNLRESPSLSAEVLRRLYKNQQLIVISSSADGWSHVKTDVIEGYVRSEYLQTPEQ